MYIQGVLPWQSAAWVAPPPEEIARIRKEAGTHIPVDGGEDGAGGVRAGGADGGGGDVIAPHLSREQREAMEEKERELEGSDESDNGVGRESGEGRV